MSKKAVSKKENQKTGNSSSTKVNIKTKTTNFFIAGIGASAGGLEAITSFFDNTPIDGGLAYIVVQHLDPTHKSILADIVSKHTKMNVFEIKNNMQVLPNCVYVMPQDNEIDIINGKLLIKKMALHNASNKLIDHFFDSLANDKKDRAMGIVLSGMGSDGTIGLQKIKAAGGVSFAQDPRTAKFKSMPENAITNKVVDYISAPEKMSKKIILYIKKNGHKTIETSLVKKTSFENELNKIYLIIKNQTGHDFSNYKSNTILRRVSKRIALKKLNSINDYIELLEHDTYEVENLYKDFLIGVTNFFRDKEIFESIEKKAIPYLIKICKHKQELRVWVCACSTGEEAYSLAILLNEAIKRNKIYLKVTILASDIDKEALNFARIGLYPENIKDHVSKERLSNYFVHKGNNYQVKKEIREMIVFAHHNVIKDPPFSKMDMITCRNLLIYMNNDLQKTILSIFQYSLNNEGILLLGASESLSEASNLYTEMDSVVKLFKKKIDINTRDFNSYLKYTTIANQQLFQESSVNIRNKNRINVSSITEKLLKDNFTPPAVVIDKNNDALYFSGNTAMYLEPPTGEARLNILGMAKNGIKKGLEFIINEVNKSKKEIRKNNINIEFNGHYTTINLIAKPILTKNIDLGAILIIFEKTEKPKLIISKKEIGFNKKDLLKVSELEKELKITREHLQNAIDELELSNTDLHTTNEEFQSANEELQSTNEELETSKEELQSVNEELITVNGELQNKISQLSQSNDDLNNLLRSIDVATIFLDKNLKIKRFTPSATKIFNLIPSDIERPVTHLSNNLIYKGLADDVTAALKTLSVKSADLETTEGVWYNMRIIPYRTNENIIEGVLITFVENTEQKKVEEKLKITNEHLNLIMEHLPAIPYICITKDKLLFSFIGKSSETITGFLPEQFENNSDFFLNRIHPEDKKKTINSFKNTNEKKATNYIFRWKCSDGKYKTFKNHFLFEKGKFGQAEYIVGVWEELKMANS